MVRALSKFIMCSALFFSWDLAMADGWAIVGAGNATCEHWNRANATTKTEILSWMAGFSSAENLNRASENRPQFRMEFLTYDYLSHEINSVCRDTKNKDIEMSKVLFKLLSQFPVDKK